MRRSLTIGEQLAGGFALLVVVMAVLGYGAKRASDGQVATARMVSHTYEVMGKVGEVLSLLKDVENTQRRFILTGNEDFLRPHRAAVDELPQQMQALRSLTSDNPRQQDHITRMQPLVTKQLAKLSVTMEVRRREGLDAAVKIIADGETMRTMDAIRAIAGEMIAEEQRLLELRHRESDQAIAAQQTFVYASTGFAIVLTIIGAMLFIRKLDRQIGASVQGLQSASSELQAAASQQAKGATGQVASSGEASATMRELVATSRQIAESAQRVTLVASDTATAARTGEQTVTAARAAIETVKQQVDRIVVHMLELGKRSQDIGAIVELINELSEQTNILAINATIEAAGAGDAGRRFGVIADEIRRLADRVGGSTKDIRALIEEVRAAANTSVMATEDGAKAADACARQFAEMTSSFARIAGSVTSTAEASREIELSTRQQSTAVEQASTAIAEVAQTARETDASSAQMLETAVQLASLARQLVTLIRREPAA